MDLSGPSEVPGDRESPVVGVRVGPAATVIAASPTGPWPCSARRPAPRCARRGCAGAAHLESSEIASSPPPHWGRRSLDLSVFTGNHCALMRQVWESFLAVWTELGPVRRPAPALLCQSPPERGEGA